MERLRSAKQLAIGNRVTFFFALVIAGIDHFSGQRVGELRYLWVMALSSIIDGGIAAWARGIIAEVEDIKKRENGQ
jgi:hypothetical protein